MSEIVLRPGPDAAHARLAHLHPVRFMLMRDDDAWAQRVAEWDALRKTDVKFRLLDIAETFLGDHLQHSLLLPTEEVAFDRERCERALDSARGAGGLETCLIEWHAGGQQIFDVSPIAALFMGSDASDLPIQFLKLPYDDLYLHWGKHLQLPSPFEGRFIEGCYVNRRADLDDNDIHLTFICSLAEGYRWDVHSLFANLVVDCEGSYAVNTVFSEDGSVGGVARALGDEVTYGPDAALWQNSIPSALSMAVNCLAYVASSKADVVQRYPANAPERLVRQTASSRPTEVARARSKLANLGFRVIHLCGENLSKRMGLLPTAREMPTHWRRGHFHTVRFGPRRSELRVDWFEPVLVNASTEGEGDARPGRIYRP